MTPVVWVVAAVLIAIAVIVAKRMVAATHRSAAAGEAPAVTTRVLGRPRDLDFSQDLVSSVAEADSRGSILVWLLRNGASTVEARARTIGDSTQMEVYEDGKIKRTEQFVEGWLPLLAAAARARATLEDNGYMRATVVADGSEQDDLLVKREHHYIAGTEHVMWVLYQATQVLEGRVGLDASGPRLTIYVDDSPLWHQRFPDSFSEILGVIAEAKRREFLGLGWKHLD